VLIISICVYVAPAATDTRKKVSIVAGAGIAVEYAATEIGGSLTGTSEGSGKGATFVLELPLAQPAAAQKAA